MDTFRLNRHQKILTIALAIIFASPLAYVIAQTWHTANQSTVAWNAVTTNINGDPIPAEETVKYSIWLANAITDPQKSNPVKVENSIASLQYTVTLGVEGRYFVGVQSERWLGDELLEIGEISWSDDPQVAQNGEHFGLRFYLPPAKTTGIRPQ